MDDDRPVGAVKLSHLNPIKICIISPVDLPGEPVHSQPCRGLHVVDQQHSLIGALREEGELRQRRGEAVDDCEGANVVRLIEACYVQGHVYPPLPQYMHHTCCCIVNKSKGHSRLD